jgi:hypothetical protein
VVGELAESFGKGGVVVVRSAHRNSVGRSLRKSIAHVSIACDVDLHDCTSFTTRRIVGYLLHFRVAVYTDRLR